MYTHFDKCLFDHHSLQKFRQWKPRMIKHQQSTIRIFITYFKIRSVRKSTCRLFIWPIFKLDTFSYELNFNTRYI